MAKMKIIMASESVSWKIMANEYGGIGETQCQ